LPVGLCCCSPQERKEERKRRTERKKFWLNFLAAQQAAVLFDSSAQTVFFGSDALHCRRITLQQFQQYSNSISLLSLDGPDRRASESLLATETGQGGPGYDEPSEHAGKNNLSIPVDEAMAECRHDLRRAGRAVCGKHGL
jgi:hypothetical protein